MPKYQEEQEVIPHKKKRQKKYQKKSDHKHQYVEEVYLLENDFPITVKYCTMCGKTYNIQVGHRTDEREELISKAVGQFPVECKNVWELYGRGLKYMPVELKNE